jgi:hypothetical protein
MKNNYKMPGLPSHLKTHPQDELVNYILRQVAEGRTGSSTRSSQ